MGNGLNPDLGSGIPESCPETGMRCWPVLGGRDPLNGCLGGAKVGLIWGPVPTLGLGPLMGRQAVFGCVGCPRIGPILGSKLGQSGLRLTACARFGVSKSVQKPFWTSGRDVDNHFWTFGNMKSEPNRLTRAREGIIVYRVCRESEGPGRVQNGVWLGSDTPNPARRPSPCGAGRCCRRFDRANTW